MAKKEEKEQLTPQQEKMKALQAAMAKIEKDFGKGSIMKMGDEKIENVEVIPTGSIGLNAALGVGGYPKGRIVEIYGPESSGKTTLAIHAIAECQKAGGIAAFIDAEHAFDRFYAEKLGVDIDNLYMSQPDNGEQALEIADQLIRSSAIDLLIVDSVAALTPKKEIEGDMGDSAVGLHARLMSQALRKLTGTIAKTNTTCIFINQLREKIGVMFGNPETTTGGNALKFYASVRLDIRKVTSLKDGDNIIGNQVRVKVEEWLVVLIRRLQAGTGSRGRQGTAEGQSRALRGVGSQDYAGYQRKGITPSIIYITKNALTIRQSIFVFCLSITRLKPSAPTVCQTSYLHRQCAYRHYHSWHYACV